MFLAVSYPYSLTFSIIFFLLNTLLLHDTIGGEKKSRGKKKYLLFILFFFWLPPNLFWLPRQHVLTNVGLTENVSLLRQPHTIKE